MIPPIRNKVLNADEPAEDLVRQNEEEERKEKEREANRKNREEVTYWVEFH